MRNLFFLVLFFFPLLTWGQPYQPAITGNSANPVLRAPTATGGQPSTINIGGASGLLQLDSSGNIAGTQTVTLSTGGTQTLNGLGTPVYSSLVCGTGTLCGGNGNSFVSLGGSTGLGYFTTTVPTSAGWLISQQTSGTASATQTLFVKKDCTNCTTNPSGNSFALNVQTNQGANDGGGEWNLRFLNNCYSTVSGSSCVGLDGAAIIQTGATGNAWGAIIGGWDKRDEDSATASSAAIPLELDVIANKADDSLNPDTYGGVGGRKGVNMGLARAVTSDTTQHEVSSGFWVSQGDPGENQCGTGTQGCDVVDQTYSVANNLQTYSVFDARGAVSPITSTAPVIALNMQVGQVADFASDVTGTESLKEAPQRYLSYNSTDSALEYKSAAASNNPLVSFKDNGNLTAAGSITGASVSTQSITGVATNIKTFTSSGTWTRPSFCSTMICVSEVTVIGGGGGGGGGAMEVYGSGVAVGGGSGGDGACIDVTLSTVNLNNPSTVSIGTAGSGGSGASVSGAGSNGATGASSNFGGTVIAGGGGAGSGGGLGIASGGGSAGGFSVSGPSAAGAAGGAAYAPNAITGGGSGAAGSPSIFGTNSVSGSGTATSGNGTSGGAAQCLGGAGSGGTESLSSATTGGSGGTVIGWRPSQNGGASNGAAGSNSVLDMNGEYETVGPSGGGGNTAGSGGGGGGCSTGYGVGGAGGGGGNSGGGSGGNACPGFVRIITHVL